MRLQPGRRAGKQREVTALADGSRCGALQAAGDEFGAADGRYLVVESGANDAAAGDLAADGDDAA